MMLLSVKTCLALFWGISVLFSTESMSASTSETSGMYSTAEPNNKTTEEVISAHVGQNETGTHPATSHTTHKLAEVSVSATPEMIATPTTKKEDVIVTYSIHSSNDITTGLVAMDSSSSAPQLLHASTTVTKAASETQPSSNILETAKPTEDQSHQQPPSTATDMISSPATAPATVPATTPATAPATALSTAPATAPATAFPTTPATTPATIPATTPAMTLATTSAPSSVTEAVPLSTTAPEAPSTSSSIASLDTATQTPVFNKTSETTNSTELSSTSQPDSVTRTHIFTSEFTGTAGLSSTTEPTTTTSQTNSTNTTAASNSTSPGAIVNPRVPKRLPIPTSRSTPATTTVSREASNNGEAKTCSTRGVVKQCLIAIASLAALATIFMVSTIVLCTKLSARKYKVTKPQTATEMMCISSLLPERDYIYTRQRNPVSNGVLVMHHGGDSDEDVGDNLTLSSFLPDNDRYV